MEDFASAALVGLVQAGLRRRGIAPPDPLGAPRDGPRTPLPLKRALLDWTAREHGLGLVFMLGTEVRAAGFDPIVHMLLRAETGEALVARWLRVEAYFHSRHRILCAPAGPHALTLTHVSRAGAPPAAAEDMLVAGLITGLLDAQGCTGVALSLVQPDGLLLDPRDPPSPPEPPVAAAGGRLAWGADPPARAAAEPAPLDGGEDAPGALARGALRLMADDPVRRWTLADLADALGRSRRTLQRRLGEDGLSLTSLVAASRIRRACRDLTETGLPLTLVGLLAGYADAAHFTRDFKRRVGITPSAYRESALAGRAGTDAA
ncbi:MAG: helix-turn-helix transcriptional regulator [Salinarimonas sp.]